MLAAPLVLIAYASAGHAQATTSRVFFTGSVSIPVDLKNLHPDVAKIRVNCTMSQYDKPGTRTRIEWPGPPSPSNPAGPAWAANYALMQAAVSNGAVKTTLVAHFGVSRDGPFVPGEVWSYNCQLQFVSRPGTDGSVTAVTPGIGPTFTGMAQLTSGNTSVDGTITLQ